MVTACYLVVATGYCSLPGGYCSLLVVTARYCSFPLLVWTFFSLNWLLHGFKTVLEYLWNSSPGVLFLTYEKSTCHYFPYKIWINYTYCCLSGRSVYKWVVLPSADNLKIVQTNLLFKVLYESRCYAPLCNFAPLSDFFAPICNTCPTL